MGKRDGRQDLVKQKKNWFVKKAKKYDGSLGKLLLWGKREKPVGFIQFGPVAEFQTTQFFYKDDQAIPHSGWCITCVAIQSDYRDKGLATRLIRNVLRDMRRRGVKKVDVYPQEEALFLNQISTGLVSLWEKCGFEKVAEVKQGRGKRTTVLMRKKL